MRYQGGKSRIAQAIADQINQNVSGGGTPFISLFCGSCAVEAKIRGFSRIICNDKQEYLIALLRAVQRGYDPPAYVSESDYKLIRDHKDLDKALTGFVGFGCSFGGKWFGGYARNKNGTNYALQSKKSLLKDMANLKDAEFTCGDYRVAPVPCGAVVYADPPYSNTTGYGGEKFDSVEFWRYMRILAQTGHQVFISELQAPADFVTVWEKPFTRTIDRNKNNQFKVTEKLFTYSGGKLNVENK